MKVEKFIRLIGVGILYTTLDSLHTCVPSSVCCHTGKKTADINMLKYGMPQQETRKIVMIMILPYMSHACTNLYANVLLCHVPLASFLATTALTGHLVMHFFWLVQHVLMAIDLPSALICCTLVG